MFISIVTGVYQKFWSKLCLYNLKRIFSLKIEKMGDALEELYEKYNILSEAKANVGKVSTIFYF